MRLKEKTGIFLLVFLLAGIFFVFKIKIAEEAKLNSLKARIDRIIENADFEIALVIKELSLKKRCSGKSFFKPVYITRNENVKFPAASLIKLPLMVCVFSASKDLKLNLNEDYILKDKDKTGGSGILKYLPSGRKFKFLDLVGLMIYRSDNTAANILVKRLGFKYLNECFSRLGLKGTRINRLIMDSSSRKKKVENYITARDASYLLEGIYRRNLVDTESSQKMLMFLLKQRVNGRINRFFPSEVKVAHKTGTLKNVVHDAGIVFSKKADFLISILTQGPLSYRKARKIIGKIAREVYRYFNED